VNEPTVRSSIATASVTAPAPALGTLKHRIGR
jgi:hypothetical protein